MTDGERSLAIFIDFENLALGFQGRRERFDIARVLEAKRRCIVVSAKPAAFRRFDSCDRTSRSFSETNSVTAS